MPTITKQQAVDRLTQAICTTGADDLAEIHNELFPERPITEDEAKQNAAAIVQEVTNHIKNGLEIEEIVDLWNVVFPTHHRVWFDDEEGLMHYAEENEPAGHAE